MSWNYSLLFSQEGIHTTERDPDAFAGEPQPDKTFSTLLLSRFNSFAANNRRPSRCRSFRREGVRLHRKLSKAFPVTLD